MLKGWNTILLGASPAPGAIESTIEKLKPDKVILLPASRLKKTL